MVDISSELKIQKANEELAYIAPKKSGLKILNVGDSRTVGMRGKSAVEVYGEDKDGNEWYAKCNMGLKWLKTNLSKIKMEAADCDVIVINLGVNDVAGSGNPEGDARQYLEVVNKLATEMKAKGKRVVFTSCNPVGTKYKYRSLTSAKANSNIDRFNKYIKENLSKDAIYVDTNSFVKQNIPDSDYDGEGLHYKTSNKKIYNYILKEVNKKVKINSNSRVSAEVIKASENGRA